MKLHIDCTGRGDSTITDYLVSKITEQIELSNLPAGTRLPSIRGFADINDVSRFTVVQVYDRLVADGLLQSRPGAGFYVTDISITKKLTDDIIESENCGVIGGAITNKNFLSVGRGSLPYNWLENAGLEKAIRKVGRSSLTELLEGYSNIYGYEPLREQLRQRLINIGISAGIDQILTVNGALSGIDIVCRTLLKSGDVVLIDDPGYHMLSELMESLEVKILGVPWNRQGPDIEALDKLASKYQPKLFITSGVNQNPTNLTVLPAVMHQVLTMAERHNFRIIEDDVFGVFHLESPLRYATLDQLNRVIYINSYSKTISGRLRIGYLALPESLVENVLQTRRLGGRTSELAERVVYELLREGNYRKHIQYLVGRLQKSREKTIKFLSQLGFEFFVIPEYGEFLWVRLPWLENSKELADEGLKNEIHFMSGDHFTADSRASPWIRFSIAWCQDPRLVKFLNEFVARKQP